MAEPIAELDIVALLADLPDESLPAGQTGTVVLIHNNGEACEVEFILEPRKSVVATVTRDKLLKLKTCRAVDDADDKPEPPATVQAALPILSYSSKPPIRARFPGMILAAMFLSLWAMISFTCMCGYMRAKALWITLPATALAWTVYLRYRPPSIFMRLLVIIALLFVSLIFIRNMEDVLWFGHNALLR